MNEEEAKELLKSGNVAAWNQTRDSAYQSGTPFPDSISNVTIDNVDLKQINFAQMNLNKVDFDNVGLDKAVFEKSILQEVNFKNIQSIKSTRFSGSTLANVTLINSDLSNINMNGLKPSIVNIEKCKGEKTNFSHSVFQSLSMTDSSFQHADLKMCEIDIAKFNDGKLSNCHFDGSKIQEIHLNEKNLSNCNFVRAIINSGTLSNNRIIYSDFDNAKLKAVKLQNATLTNTKFRGATIVSCDFNGADLSGVDFGAATLKYNYFYDVTVSNTTSFSSVKSVEKCRIDRYILESLRDDYAGLSKGDRMRMIIRDDVAKLQTKFSGFWQWLHIIFFTAFVFPYIWFIVKQWSIASFRSDTETVIPLWMALFRFIYSGGEHWKEGWIYRFEFITFLIAFSYNIPRFILFIKTKILEQKQKISGLPAIFRLNKGFWKCIYWVFLISSILASICVIWNTIHFFTIKVPV